MATAATTDPEIGDGCDTNLIGVRLTLQGDVRHRRSMILYTRSAAAGRLRCSSTVDI